MSTVVKNEKELGEAIKKDAIEIEVERNSLTGQTVIRVKAAGRLAWGVCTAAFAIAVTSITYTFLSNSSPPGDYSPGVGMPGEAPGAPFPVPAPAPSGMPTGMIIAIVAIAIGIICCGFALLNKFRKYKMKERDGKIILTKK